MQRFLLPFLKDHLGTIVSPIINKGGCAMRYMRFLFALFAFIGFGIAQAEDSNPLSKLAWQFGPTQGAIGEKATINIPEGFAFLGATDTKKFMELNQNLASGSEYLMAPTSLAWFAVFEFKPTGYVKDDETVDANAILESIKEGTEAGNEERKKRGWPTMSITGWRFQPQYDRQTKLLEWALLAKSDANNEPIVNYNTRLLGRTGVMEVVLVAEPGILDTAVGELKTALTAYKFVPGEKYSEFKQGDRVAEFGLAALIAGGAAAVAVKKGLFTVILGFLAATWKFIAVAIVGAFTWMKSYFKKKNQ
jgi:uncharacterized membrane-anchored protein